jgi:hypothetical protein
MKKLRARALLFTVGACVDAALAGICHGRDEHFGELLAVVGVVAALVGVRKVSRTMDRAVNRDAVPSFIAKEPR